jgi:hypothetical protein
MTRKRIREGNTQSQGSRSSSAADPQCQLPDPGQPVIASCRRKMQVVTHAGTTLPGLWSGLDDCTGRRDSHGRSSRLHQHAPRDVGDRFRKSSELVNHDQSSG